MENMTQEEEDKVPIYMQKSDEEMYDLFQQKCGNDIVLDLDSYNIDNLRDFLMEMEKRVTLVKDHIVNVSLLHNINENEMIKGIFITVGEKKIELFVSANNLYMRGFKIRGITHEAIEEHRRLPGSRNLGFGVSYQDLGMDFETFQFGWSSIRKAANILRKCQHNPGPDDYVQLKSAFRIIIVMILETLRFHKVRRKVLQCYESYRDENWNALKDIVKDWKKSYNKYHMWRHAKDKSSFNADISIDDQFIIDRFPTMISESGLAMSPPPRPLSEDEFNDYAYNKKVANILTGIRFQV